MLKIGLIGSVGAMTSHIQQLKSNAGVQIIGKSSVGMMEGTEARFLSIPEYNRKELIEAADVLIIDKSQLLLPDLIKTAVKNNKHLFITDFPDISPENCSELLKLSDEARTVVYIRNQLNGESLTNWLSQNWQEPACISLFESMATLPDKRTFLTKNLLYAFSLFKSFPQKIRVSGINHPETDFYFINIRLDYPTFSTFNLELLIQPNGSRNLRAALPGKYLSGDFASHKAQLNQHEMVLHTPVQNEINNFLLNWGNDDFYMNSNLGLYCSMLFFLRDVLKKIELFTPWH
jgi:hypothetical protein